MHYELILAFLIDNKSEVFSQTLASDALEVVHAAGEKKSVHNHVTKVFLETFTKECEPRIDALPESFFTASRDERMKTISTWGKGTLLTVLGQFALTANYRELQSLVRDVYETFGDAHEVILVTTPRPLDSKTKATIRAHYKHGVVFQIDQSIVGGMRVYMGGTITDHSFASLLSRISNLTT